MKKIVGAAAMSALVLAAAGPAFAGSKYVPPKVQSDSCPGGCQDQIDALQSSQARQDEQINGLNTDQRRQDSDINGLRNDQARQDGAINDLRGDQARQDGAINDLRGDQARQDGAINDLRGDQGRQDSAIDALRADQARQDEQLRANNARIDQNTNDINTIKSKGAGGAECSPWYVKGIGRMIWTGSMDVDKVEYGFKAATDTGFGVGLAGGRRFGNLRVEGEVATQKSDIEGPGLDDVTIKTLMFNGFYHIPLPEMWVFGAPYNGMSLYGTAGMGAGKVEFFFEDGNDDSETTFAYKVGMGMAFDMTYNLALDVGYEYMRTNDIELGADHGLLRADDVKNSSVSAALRYSF